MNADKPMRPVVEVAVVKPDDKFAQAHIHRRIEAHWIGSFAMELVKMMVLHGEPDGETTAGHPKSRMISTDEAISRAFDISEKTLAEMEKRGWAIDVPSFEELRQPGGVTAGFRRTA